MHVYQVVRFEKSGAPSIESYSTLDLSRAQLDVIPHPDPFLIRDHLRTCIA